MRHDSSSSVARRALLLPFQPVIVVFSALDASPPAGLFGAMLIGPLGAAYGACAGGVVKLMLHDVWG